MGDLAVVGQHRDLGHYYHGSDPTVFERLRQQRPIDPAQFTFVDYGSGKGKALLLAALWPFQAVLGVEFAQALNVVSRDLNTFSQFARQVLMNLPNVKDLHTSFSLGEVKGSGVLPLRHLA